MLLPKEGPDAQFGFVVSPVGVPPLTVEGNWFLNVHMPATRHAEADDVVEPELRLAGI